MFEHQQGMSERNRQHDKQPGMQKKENEEEEGGDPLDDMLSRTGCLQLHHAVQACIAETQDWRRCQKEVSAFRDCMAAQQSKREAELKSRLALA
uniref:cytochrome c oxidase assembly factor 4 homolog, mitochondrial isoform X2 n=1 Tax=Myxine glutinosa TaxID=7769 RepID=UPI00358F0D28